MRTAVGGVTDSAADITTHTGQRYDDDDFRLNRFIGGKVKIIQFFSFKIKTYSDSVLVPNWNYYILPSYILKANV